MGSEKKKDYSLFNKAFFIFSFKLVMKKVSIYVSIIVYLIILALYAIVVPLVADTAPIDLLNVSTSVMFLMFAISIVACFVSLEVFRTSIDDGTELLTVSKPISRKEIIFMKLCIFLLFMLLIAVFSLIVGAFTYAIPKSEAEDSLTIMMGMFTATLVNGIIFGSIATILSIYFKKIMSMLITVGFSFILIIASTLTSFIIDTPVEVVSNRNQSITSVNIVNADQTNASNTSTIQGILATDTEKAELIDPETAWNDAVATSGYNTSVMFDIGYQISSIYTLTSVNTDLQTVLASLSSLNQPVNLVFQSIDTTSISNVNLSYTNPSTQEQTNMNLFLNFGSSSSIGSRNTLSSGSYSGRDRSEITEISSAVANDTTNTYSWSTIWNTYGNNSATTYDVSDFIESFFSNYNNGLSTNYEEASQSITELSKIQYAVYLDLVNNGLNLNDTSNLIQNTVKLGLLGYTLDTTNYTLNYSTTIDFEYNTFSLRFSNRFALLPEDVINMAKTADVEPVLSSAVLIPVWVCIAFVIFLIASLLYFRRDFA